ncbi:MAG: class I SAM-dependent methyltransferase [Flavobacteriales bacterium]|nr:class I SAM-dependent methyltransferase [Flavobacteriales bacterium]
MTGTSQGAGPDAGPMGRARHQPPVGAADPIDFFDRISAGYGSRYQGQDRFHRYYFQERMNKAVDGLDLADCNVLDIGSGTGDLYDQLITRFPSMQFLATDVSAGMLAHSNVPQAQQYIGPVYEHNLGPVRFHAIFMLGVTTYMGRDELEKNLDFIARHLHPDGRFIATFTNRSSLDSWMRSLAQHFVKPDPAGRNVLSSGLQIHKYTYPAIRAMLEPKFRIMRWDALNHTIFPFNRLLPGLSIRAARQLGRTQGVPGWLRFLSSDLMVHATLHP